MSEHLARHVLERLIADDVRDRVAPAARVHVASCDHCGVRKRSLQTARAQYLAASPAAAFAQAALAEARMPPAKLARASLWRRLRWPVAALLLAGAIALGVVFRRDLALPANAIRWQCEAAALQVYVRRGAQAHALRDGEALSAGDQLAFTYTLAQPRHLLLLGIDDSGAVTRYYPDATLAPVAALQAGNALSLPVGIALDARRGQERLVALFSRDLLDERSAHDALTTAFAAARADGKGVAGLGELALPAAQATVWFDKP